MSEEWANYSIVFKTHTLEQGRRCVLSRLFMHLILNSLGWQWTWQWRSEVITLLVLHLINAVHCSLLRQCEPLPCSLQNHPLSRCIFPFLILHVLKHIFVCKTLFSLSYHAAGLLVISPQKLLMDPYNNLQKFAADVPIQSWLSGDSFFLRCLMVLNLYDIAFYWSCLILNF